MAINQLNAQEIAPVEKTGMEDGTVEENPFDLITPTSPQPEEFDIANNLNKNLGIWGSKQISNFFSGEWITNRLGGSLVDEAGQKVSRGNILEQAEIKRREKAKRIEAGEPVKDVITTKVIDSDKKPFKVERIGKKEFAIIDTKTNKPLETFTNRKDANKRYQEIRPKPDVEEQPILGQAAEDIETQQIVSSFGIDEQNTARIFNANDEDTATVITSLLEPKRTDLISGGLTDFNAKNLPNEDSVVAGIEATSQRYKGKITKENRGVVTQEAQRQLAELIGMKPEKLTQAILNRKMGGTINIEGMGLAETMLAARDLLVTEAAKLDKLAKIASEGGKADKLNFKRQLTLVGNLQAQIKGSQTEIARALGQFNIAARNVEGEEGANLINKDLTGLADEFGGEEHLDAAVSAYLDLPSGTAQRLRYAQDIGKFKKFTNAAYEAWINILLSSPVTHFRNTVGTFVTTFATIPNTAIAAGLGSVRRGLTGATDGVRWGEVQASMFAAMTVQREAWQLAGRSFLNPSDTSSLLSGSKIDYHKQRENAFSAEAFGASGVTGQAVNILGNVATLGRTPTRLLQFEDAYWKVMANRMELYKLAYRDGLAKGLDKNPDAFAEHISDFLINPPANAIDQGETVAKYVALQADLGKHGKTIGKAARVPIMRWFVPFFKTPVNMVKYVSDHSPAGALFGDTKAMLRKGGADADMARGRIAMGSSVMMAGMLLAMEGRITGGGPRDAEMRQVMMDNDWRPYSIKFGNTYYNYTGAEPMATLFSLVAEIHEVMETGQATDDEAWEIMAGAAASMGYMLTNKTMLQGTATFMDAVRDPSKYGPKVLEDFARSVVPSVVGQINRTYVDDTIRHTFSLLDRIKSRTPGYSKTLPPRRNIWGKKIMYDPALGPDIVSPISMSTIETNPVNDEIIRLQTNISPHPDKLKLFKEYDAIKLSPEKKDFFDKRAGELAFKILSEEMLTPDGKSLNRDWQEGIATSPDWGNMRILKAFRTARDIAQKELMEKYEKELIDLREKLKQKADEELQTYRQQYN